MKKKASAANKRAQGNTETLRILSSVMDIIQNQQYKFGESIDKEEAEHQKIKFDKILRNLRCFRLHF